MRYGRVLTTLAAEHGLSNLRRAGDGHVVADIADGRTLFVVADFELEARALIRADIAVISSGAPLAGQVDNGPFTVSSAA